MTYCGTILGFFEDTDCGGPARPIAQARFFPQEAGRGSRGRAGFPTNGELASRDFRPQCLWLLRNDKIYSISMCGILANPPNRAVRLVGRVSEFDRTQRIPSPLVGRGIAYEYRGIALSAKKDSWDGFLIRKAIGGSPDYYSARGSRSPRLQRAA